MEINHPGDVHAVNVIGAEDRNKIRMRLLDQVDVLVDCVRRSLVPGFALGTHLSGNVRDEVAFQKSAELPALAQVLQQRLAAELCEHVDRVDSGIHKIAENEVDDSILAAEGNCRFRALAGQRIEARSFSSGEHDSQYPAAKRYRIRLLRHEPSQKFPQDGTKGRGNQYC